MTHEDDIALPYHVNRRELKMVNKTHGTCMGTLGLMDCQKYVLCVVRKRVRTHDSDVLREKIESWENS